jgi:hypothetical protein
MGYKTPTEVVASASRTADGNSGLLQIRPKATELVVFVDVTAQSGTTPTLDLSIEWSQDGGTTFAAGDPADAFTQIAATTPKVVKKFDVKGSGYRVVWDLEGTSADYTFSVRELHR